MKKTQKYTIREDEYNHVLKDGKVKVVSSRFYLRFYSKLAKYFIDRQLFDVREWNKHKSFFSKRISIPIFFFIGCSALATGAFLFHIDNKLSDCDKFYGHGDCMVKATMKEHIGEKEYVFEIDEVISGEYNEPTIIIKSSLSNFTKSYDIVVNYIENGYIAYIICS